VVRALFLTNNEDKMNETNCESQEIKPKTSKLAIISALVPFVLCINSLLFILLIRTGAYELFFLKYLLICSYFIVVLSVFLLPAFITVGIWASIKILISKRILKGFIFSFSGIIFSIVAFFVAYSAFNSKIGPARLEMCQRGMTKLHNAITEYSKTHNNKYPYADKWCDLLTTENPNIKGWFLCFESNSINREPPYKSFFAINPNAEPNSAGDVVLLFETKDGWNQFGGPELMSFDNHYRKGCNVLFNDGHVEFVPPKKKDKLNWETKKSTK
jgi:prepilin-type processing-associated H-X9-DG protein